jgi:hypothetical protein
MDKSYIIIPTRKIKIDQAISTIDGIPGCVAL